MNQRLTDIKVRSVTVGITMPSNLVPVLPRLKLLYYRLLAFKSQPWRTSLCKEDHRTLFKALLPVHKNAKPRLQIEHLN